MQESLDYEKLALTCQFEHNAGGVMPGLGHIVTRPAKWVPNKKPLTGSGFLFGADYGARTRHLHLGKVALYQMS